MLDTIQVANPNAEHAERVVNPYVAAVRTLRDDPIGQMHARGQLGPTAPEKKKTDKWTSRDPSIHYPGDNRLEAARRFQAAWEASGKDGRLRSPDFDGVPGSSDPSKRSGFNDWQMKAGDQLKRWERSLGDAGYKLLCMILIDKRTVAEAARHRHGVATKAIVTYIGHRLKECLDALT